MTMPMPPPAVLRAFGLESSPVLLPGGQATTWHVGEAVIKPLDMEPSLLRWQGELLNRLDGRHDFRVSLPLPTIDGRWVADGWTAWRYEPGAHLPGRWHEIISVGQRLHEALQGEPEPPFPRERSDKWAIADRVAWGELPAATYATTRHLSALTAARRPVDGRSQLVHGDLTGNVLFHQSLPPLVIDLSPYWRPPAYASAIVIADALVFGDASPKIVKPLLDDPAFPQYLLRALIFRAVTDQLSRSELGPPSAVDPYRSAVEFALRLVRRPP